MKQHSAERPYPAVFESTRDFAALKEEWEDLYQNSPLATPFQAGAWLYSWWEHCGEDYELRLLAVRYRNLLVGLMPLVLDVRWGSSIGCSLSAPV